MSDFWNSFVQNMSVEMGAGKYLALTLVGIFFLWLLGRYNKNERTRLLLLVGITISVLVIVPFTGMLLMAYQTRFFDYRHLLLLLFPMIFIPWAFTEAVDQGYGALKRNAEEGELAKEKPWMARTVGILIAVLLLMLSGNLITEGVDVELTLSRDKVPADVEEVLELLEDGEILIAPDEVIEYARAYNGDLRLVYGRDMFEPGLKAYTYNVYDKDVCEIYEWMQDLPIDTFELDADKRMQLQREKDKEAMALIADTPCSALVLSHATYERLWQTLEAGDLQGFEMLEETTQYTVLIRR